jgi:fumarate reductase flavoprotein subunit
VAEYWDLIIVGAGTAGMPAAIFAAQRGAHVLVLEAASEVGGTLHLSAGQMSAAGSRLQAEKGIEDTPDEHYDDCMRISNNTADPALVRLTVDNAADTLNWLQDIGTEILPEHPVLAQGHEAYRKPRYYWGPDGGRSLLKSIAPAFEKEIAKGGVTLKLETEVTGLIQDDRTVTGVRARTNDGAETEYLGHNVLMASGGHAANVKMSAEQSGVPLYGNGAYAFSQGAGIAMGTSAGGWTRGKENYICAFNVVLEKDEIGSPLLGRIIAMPHVRMPWEIFVNVHGKRFVQEDHESVDHREHMLMEQPDMRCWSIFDDVIANESPDYVATADVPHPRRWTKAEMFEAFGKYPTLHKADSLGELATKAGIDGNALKATVEEYNAARGGADPLGREHRPRPIEKAPFYAIQIQGSVISSVVGLAVNGELQVIDADNRPIAGLYAAGELLGAGQTMGNAAVGGMMVMPAMTFGRLLGQRMLSWPGSKAEAAE